MIVNDQTTVTVDSGWRAEVDGNLILLFEIVLLIGAGSREVSQDDVDAALRDALRTMRLKEAARDVAERLNLSSRDIYQRGLKLQDRD